MKDPATPFDEVRDALAFLWGLRSHRPKTSSAPPSGRPTRQRSLEARYVDVGPHMLKNEKISHVASMRGRVNGCN